MDKFPESWCTDVCPEVVKWLNDKYSEKNGDTLKGTDKFYGESNGDWKSHNDGKWGSYITNEEFRRIAGIEEILKVGDFVFVSDEGEEYVGNKKYKLIAILPEGMPSRFIVEKSDNNWWGWEYAVRTPKEKRKERKLMLTDIEWEKLKKVYEV